MALTPAVPHLPETTAYSWPVPREFVHKTAHTEVLLTGWRRCGEREFEVGAQWPRDHGFWRTDGGGVQDPMLLVETTRQVLPLLAHAAYGVPAGHQLIWDHHHCAFTAPFLSVTGSPAEVVLDLSASQAPDRSARLRRITLTMTVRGAGRVLGTASTVYTAHSPRVYARLRGPGTPPPPEAMAAALLPPAALRPSLVGRESEREVVLAAREDENRGGSEGESEGGYEPGSAGGTPPRQLRVVTTSPWLFDHPVDHVPGMLLMEAARQCAHLAAAPHRPLLTRMEAEFHRYVDLDAPSWVEVTHGPEEDRAGRPGGERTLTVSVTQHGERAFTAVVGFVTDASVATAPGPGLG